MSYQWPSYNALGLDIPDLDGSVCGSRQKVRRLEVDSIDTGLMPFNAVIWMREGETSGILVKAHTAVYSFRHCTWYRA